MPYKLKYNNFREWKKGAREGLWTFGKKHDYMSKRERGRSIFTKHGKEYFPLIFETIRMHDPSVFIELGTHRGGLTLAINEEFPVLPIITFDNKNLSTSYRDLFNGNVIFLIEDLLSGKNKKLIEIIKSFAKGKIFMYCDNGNKVYEINTYSKYLTVGDVIGCHDWFVEVSPEKIEEALMDFEWFNIEPWDSSGMLSRFWIKKKKDEE